MAGNGEQIDLLSTKTPKPKLQANWADDYAHGSFEATFAALYQEAFDILVARQRKYGPENIASMGIMGVTTRLADDKVNRIRRALTGKVVNGEVHLDPIPEGEAGDTWEDGNFDASNYGIINIALHRDEWGRPLEEDM